MFTQKLSMDCTREQYEKYLKNDLLKMGYRVSDLGDGIWDVIVNNYNGRIGEITNTSKDRTNQYDRTYLGSFNAPLFLALAAMTDDTRLMYGEYVVRKDTGALLRNDWGNQEFNYPDYPKATVSEIMQKFGENNVISVQITGYGKIPNSLTKDTKMTKEKDLRELLQSGRIVELRDGNMGIIIATHMGLLVQLEDVWHDFTNYDENFKSTITIDNDIVRIREIRREYQVIRKDFKDAPIVWERKEVKEYTLDEVLKMAGLDKAEVKVIQK